MEWYKFNGEKLKYPIEVMVDLAIVHEMSNGNKIKVCVGTDSQVKGTLTQFATVLLFLREKKGGYIYFTRQKSALKLSIKERMIAEVTMSIQWTYELFPILQKYSIPLEVHADINTDSTFKSNTALKEAMGYIMGMGYVFKAKPEAFASSYCADRLVH